MDCWSECAGLVRSIMGVDHSRLRWSESSQEPGFLSEPGATRHHLPRKCAVPRKCDAFWLNVLQCMALQAPQATTLCALGTQNYSRACACDMDGPQPASAPAAPSCLQAIGARVSGCERIVVDLPAYKECALSMSLRCFCEASAVFRRCKYTCTCQPASSRYDLAGAHGMQRKTAHE